MASSEHSTARPCAFCGLGEPSASKSHGICSTCAEHVELSDRLILLRDPVLNRKVVLVPVQSENIEYAGWRTAGGDGILLLRFKGNTTTFRYENIPHSWWIDFLRAPSKGAFFHSTVRADKARYPFTTL